MAMANATLISCNSSTSTNLPLNNHKSSRTSLHFTQLKVSSLSPHRYVLSSSKSAIHLKRCRFLQICHSSSLKNQQEESKEESVVGGSKNGNGNGNGNGGRDWTSSILLFFLWAGLIYYVFFLTPNQTPSRDMYFLQKLLNLKGDDGFRMNEVLVSLWYIMGLWPLAYSMLLLPTGRSSKSKVPVWPFLLLSCFGGAYALLPYFILWNPPAPPVEETELKSWPLIFLESKVTAVISLAAGACIIIYACLAGADTWTEFFQYFRESKFIHITSIDFTLLSTFAPFWVYNDMTTRKWFDKGSWLLPISLIPFLGPGLYLLLRPSLSTIAIPQTPAEPE